MTDEQVVNKFEDAMAGKARAWRMSLEDNPLALLGASKHDGDFIVNQPGKLDADGNDISNTIDMRVQAAWMAVDAARAAKDRTFPLAAAWLRAFEERYVQSQPRHSDATRHQRRLAFIDAHRQREGESARDHFMRCLAHWISSPTP